MTLREALAAGRTSLNGHRCSDSDPGREAELFLEKASGLSREAILTSPELELTAPQAELFMSYVARRGRHEPTAYVAGTAWFLGREFAVSPATLIPRPATEIIFDAALAACRRHVQAAVFDVGAGSGCLAVSLAAALPLAEVTALDISPAALEIARKNAAAHGLGGRVSFRPADLLAGLDIGTAHPDRATVIVANLPYLPTAMIAGLDREIKDFEPVSALDGGADGLDLCRRLIGQAAELFAGRDLHLILELLPEQYGPLAAFAQKKIPGLKAEKISNLSGVCVGAALSAYCPEPAN